MFTLLNDGAYSQAVRITAQLEGGSQPYGPRSVSVERINSVFYKNWKMIGSSKPKKAAAN